MIIKDIYIDGFGIFHKFQLNGLNKGINIIAGRNEAGKSTLQKFIRFTLFGYPRLKDQRMQALNGGEHLGRIKALMASGREIVFERAGNDRITFFEGDSASQDGIKWNQLLGNCTDSIFQNIYAFTLDELAGMVSLNSSGLEDRIFSIGSGLGSISVGDISRELQAEADCIYSVKGKNQVIPGLLKSISEKKAKINEIQGNLGVYNELHQRIAAIEKDTNSLDKELKDLRYGKERLEHYLKCYESFIVIDNIDTELVNLPPLKDYPVDGLEQLNQLESDESDLKQEISEFEEGSEDAKGIKQIMEELAKTIFNETILKKKDEVNYLSNNLEVYKRSVNDRHDLSESINVLNISIGDSLCNISKDWSEQNITGLNEITIHQDRIKNFKKRFGELAEKRKETETYKRIKEENKSPLNAMNLMAMISAIAVLGASLLFYLKLFIPGIICVFTASVIYFGRKRILPGDAIAELEDKLSKLEAEERSLNKNYEEYLVNVLGIDKSLVHDTVLEILSAVVKLKQDIRERDTEITKLGETEAFIRDFEDKVNAFRDVVKYDDAAEISNHVSLITSVYNEANVKSGIKANFENQLEVLERKLKKSKETLVTTEDEIKNILIKVEAVSRDDYRQKFRTNGMILTLQDARKKAVLIIETVAGKGKSEEVMEFLKAAQPENLKLKIGGMDGVISSKDSELRRMNEELGKCKSELRRIEKESELAELLTDVEVEKQKLDIAHKEWLTNKVALIMLNEVREKFEREKQPEVIKNSSVHFRRITNEKFVRIAASMDKKEITVFDRQEASRKIDQLSRGTKEQLLVSLRLGFIEEYEKHSEPLPLVVDEIFVNFDPVRTARVADILSEFSKERQIIIFTCHPSTLDYFDKSKINVIELQSVVP